MRLVRIRSLTDIFGRQWQSTLHSVNGLHIENYWESKIKTSGDRPKSRNFKILERLSLRTKWGVIYATI